MDKTRGIVYLVGAGPGDPGLLTRKGHDALSRADVVVYDQLANDRLLDIAPPAAERIFAGKTKGRLTLPQAEINRLLADRAARGLRVVRLKGGDPFVFGRGAEEAEHLREAGIGFVVVPGVTAGIGATAYAGLAVTHRSAASSVAFVTGHHDPAVESDERTRVDWAALARFPGTLVVYMGVTRLAALCEALIGHGKAPTTPAAMVEAGTLPRQRTLVSTLAELPDAVAASGIGPPALLIVGEVVARRPALNWFEELPLFGRRIVVTRPADPEDASAQTLEDLGAEVLTAPMVSILPVADPAPIDAAIDRLPEFDWLVFTSSHGVAGFLDRIEATGRDVRVLGPVKIAAIGPSTAATLARYRLRADLVPDSHRSEGLAESLGRVATGQRLLLARADRGRPLLRDELEKVARVEAITVYRNVDAASLPDQVARRVEEGTVDWITLTSSAVAERLSSLLPESARSRVGVEIRLASLSPLTTATAQRLGWEVAAEAAEPSWGALVAAIVAVEGRGA